jgi:hypothetical protein
MFTDELTLQIVFESDSIENDVNQFVTSLQNVIIRPADLGHASGQQIDWYTIAPDTLRQRVREVCRGSCIIDLWLAVPQRTEDFQFRNVERALMYPNDSLSKISIRSGSTTVSAEKNGVRSCNTVSPA